MFSNLIESGSHAADLKRKGRFFLGSMLFYGLLLAVTGVGSIYAYNVRLDYDPDYELVALMRFPPVAATRSEEPARREPQRAATSGGGGPARIAQVPEASINTPYPARVASAGTPTLRTNQPFTIGPAYVPEAGGGPVNPNGGFHGRGTGPYVGPSVNDPGDGDPPPALASPTPKPAPRQEGPVRLSSSIISSKTIAKPAPPYPPVARAAGVQGPVAVQILVDEQGRVVSAKATSGNPLLQQAAVQAAYRARFTPTMLGGQPVKVTGSITYNFVIN